MRRLVIGGLAYLLSACASSPEVAVGEILPTPGRLTGIVFQGLRSYVADLSVVGPDDPGGFSAVAKNADVAAELELDPSWGLRHVDGRAIELSEMAKHRDVVKRIILGATVTVDAERAFEAETGRGVTSHFIVDFDGVVYQPLDVGLAARRARSTPERDDEEIVIALVNPMVSLLLEPNEAPFSPSDRRAAELALHPRAISENVAINGRAYVSHGYTEAQYRSLAKLLQALIVMFPNVSAGPPVAGTGTVPYGLIPDWPTRNGIFALWHTRADAWFPGPGFEWERVRHDLDAAK